MQMQVTDCSGRASHTVTLRGGSSEVCRGVESKAWEIQCHAWHVVERRGRTRHGLASIALHTAFLRERGSNAVDCKCRISTGSARFDTSRITVRESRIWNATTMLAPECIAWARYDVESTGSSHGASKWCAAEGLGDEGQGNVCPGQARLGVEWRCNVMHGLELSPAEMPEAFAAVRNGAARQVVLRHGSHRQHHAPHQREAL